jgi:hypothetical protein
VKKATSKELTRQESAEVKSLAALPDNAMDAPGAPEIHDWSAVPEIACTLPPIAEGVPARETLVGGLHIG